MIWIIMALFFSVIFCIWFFEDFIFWYDGILEFLLRGITTLVVSALIFLLAFLVSMLWGLSVPEYVQEYELTNQTKIIALKDNQNIQGSYYLFSGHVDDKLYYYYATETEHGYSTNKICADSSYIKCTAEEPRIETYEATKFKKKWIYLFAIPIDIKYMIYCPENTITTEFNVDLE